MSKRSKKSIEEKLDTVLSHLEKGKSLGQLSRRFDVAMQSLEKWTRCHQSDGIDVLVESHTWKKYTSELKKSAVEDNLLNRDFTATAPNQKWCTDVTFMTYGLGSKAYLSAIKDLYDVSIVAYHISQLTIIHWSWQH